MKRLFTILLLSFCSCAKSQTGYLGRLVPNAGWSGPLSASLDTSLLGFTLYDEQHFTTYQPENLIAGSDASLSASKSYTTYPLGAWWTVAADVQSISSGIVVVGLVKDDNNYFGLAYRQSDGKVSGVYTEGGVVTYSGWSSGTYTNPHIRFVCEGTYALGIVNGTNTGIWDAQAALSKDFRSLTYYDGSYKYGVLIQGTATLTNVKAGYFGCTAVGDNSIVVYEDGTPYLSGNKIYWGCSLRGFYNASETLGNLLENNQNAIMSYDYIAKTIQIETIVFTTGASVLYGEGSPFFLKDRQSGLWYNFSPAWHKISEYGFLMNGDNACHISKTYTASNIISAGGVVFPIATEIVPDVAKEYSYDPAWIKLSNGKWMVTYTTQRQSPYKMYNMMYETTDFINFTQIYDGNLTTGYWEGVRMGHIGGQPYFIAAGYNKIRFHNLSGTIAAEINQPTEVSNADLSGYPSHGAMFTVNISGVDRRLYLGFNSVTYAGEFSYGKTFIYID